MLVVVTIVSLLLAVACAVYGFLAFFNESAAEKKVKEAATEVNDAAKEAAKATKGEAASLAEGVTPQAAFSGPTEYLKALALFSEALAKLKRDLAAFVLSLSFLLVATISAGIEDKFEDKNGKAGNPPAATTTPG
jgi:type II secretory pathway pseudopilin PulG